MYTGLHIKYPLFLPDFNETWIYSTKFREVFKYKILWKSAQLGAELLPEDGRKDKHDEANSCFFAILRTRLNINQDSEPRTGTDVSEIYAIYWSKRKHFVPHWPSIIATLHEAQTEKSNFPKKGE